MSILKIENVSKTYRQGEHNVPVLNNLNMEVEKGEILSLMGKSGSGKTTLLKIIGTLMPPTKGNVIFLEENIYSKSSNYLCDIRRKKIGFVFQSYELIHELTAYENIIFPLLLSKEKVDRGYLKQLCELLMIKEKIQRYPEQLSGGEQQRVGIARALIYHPELLICDEPTGNLDCTTTEMVMNMLSSIHEEYNTTIIIATHDVDVASYANRQVTL